MNLAKPIDGPEALKPKMLRLNIEKPQITKQAGEWCVFIPLLCNHAQRIAAQAWVDAQNRKECNSKRDSLKPL